MKTYAELQASIVAALQIAADICDGELINTQSTVNPLPYASIRVTAEIRRKNGKDLGGRTLYVRAGKDLRVRHRQSNIGTTYVVIGDITVYFGIEDRGVINVRATSWDELNRVDDNTNGHLTDERCAEYAKQVQELLPLY